MRTAPEFHPVAGLRLVVVLIDDALGRVDARPSDLLRDAAVPVPGNRAGAHLVWRPRGRTLARLIVVRELARSPSLLRTHVSR